MDKKYKHIFKRNQENIEKIALLDIEEDEKEIFKSEEILVFIGTQEEAVEIEFKDGEISISVDKLKSKKREELKKIREEKISENIEVDSNLFQVRKNDLDNFYNLKIAADLDEKMKSQKVNWILADNTIKEFDYTDLMKVLSAYMLRKQQLFAKFGELALQLESAKTVEETESINWE